MLTHNIKNTLITMSILAILLIGFFSIGPYLSCQDHPAISDAIVVISGGGPERIATGVSLYDQKLSKLLILSGNAFSGETSNAESMRRAAIKSSVPQANIITEDKAETTYENALYVKKILSGQEHSENKIILV
ncbi:MAG: YdcF family protein [Patescibacteria group bacterium]|nr:YdcF family protein [Patescibacteria group bacterium]